VLLSGNADCISMMCREQKYDEGEGLRGDRAGPAEVHNMRWQWRQQPIVCVHTPFNAFLRTAFCGSDT